MWPKPGCVRSDDLDTRRPLVDPLHPTAGAGRSARESPTGDALQGYRVDAASTVLVPGHG
jgi:hypothetical protein